jgi:hypothetical protein
MAVNGSACRFGSFRDVFGLDLELGLTILESGLISGALPTAGSGGGPGLRFPAFVVVPEMLERPPVSAHIAD